MDAQEQLKLSSSPYLTALPHLYLWMTFSPGFCPMLSAAPPLTEPLDLQDLSCNSPYSFALKSSSTSLLHPALPSTLPPCKVHPWSISRPGPSGTAEGCSYTAAAMSQPSCTSCSR